MKNKERVKELASAFIKECNVFELVNAKEGGVIELNSLLCDFIKYINEQTGLASSETPKELLYTKGWSEGYGQCRKEDSLAANEAFNKLTTLYDIADEVEDNGLDKEADALRTVLNDMGKDIHTLIVKE